MRGTPNTLLPHAHKQTFSPAEQLSALDSQQFRGLWKTLQYVILTNTGKWTFRATELFLTRVAWRRQGHRACVAAVWMVVISKVKNGFGFWSVFTSWSRLSVVHPIYKRQIDGCFKRGNQKQDVWSSSQQNQKWDLQERTLHVQIRSMFVFVLLLHLSLSLSKSSSSTCTACLWYCSWDSTNDESWLTCSICTWTQTEHRIREIQETIRLLTQFACIKNQSINPHPLYAVMVQRPTCTQT